MDPEVVRILVESAMALGLLGAGGRAAWTRWRSGGPADAAGESTVSRRQAKEAIDAAVAEAERLVRIEGKIDRLGDSMAAGFRRVDERQAEHEADDDRRHAAVLAELTRAGERLHEHDTWHTAHVGHLAEVRERLEMDTQVGPAPSPRTPRTAPRPAVAAPPRRTR